MSLFQLERFASAMNQDTAEQSLSCQGRLHVSILLQHNHNHLCQSGNRSPLVVHRVAQWCNSHLDCLEEDHCRNEQDLADLELTVGG